MTRWRRRLLAGVVLVAGLGVVFALAFRPVAGGVDPFDPDLPVLVEPVRTEADVRVTEATREKRRRLLAEVDPARLEAYMARRPKTVLELQPFRRVDAVPIEDSAGARGEATLVDLNPRVGAWLILELRWADGRTAGPYHLENPAAETVEVALDPAYPRGLLLRGEDADARCALWVDAAATALEAARGAEPYAPLCDGALYLRNPAAGRRTARERATDLLRDHVWGGEKITVFVRDRLYQDAFLQTSELVAPADPGVAARPRPPGAPDRPRVDPRYDGQLLYASGLGITLEETRDGKVLAGRWYPAREREGIFVSVLQPRLVAPEVVAGWGGRVNALDAVEAEALVYLVAFDLDRFALGFALGTEHPRLEWSERVPASVRDPAMPGPDGIADPRPLVRTGRLSPADVDRVAATFTGGFKRAHGAFKFGEKAVRHAGTHYGFIEQGTILSKLQPGLGTLVVWDDGAVELMTWRVEDDARLDRVRFARQNGVALVETDPATGTAVPGALLARWGEGNWSGSADRKLRSLRAGACIQDGRDGRFLLYGYFSSATPSAMARVFAAAGCGYAILLDMNALEHTYLALYRTAGDRFLTEHLVEGMEVLDRADGDQELPRFVAVADNRDFFYLLRKPSREEAE